MYYRIFLFEKEIDDEELKNKIFEEFNLIDAIEKNNKLFFIDKYDLIINIQSYPFVENLCKIQMFSKNIRLFHYNIETNYIKSLIREFNLNKIINE